MNVIFYYHYMASNFLLFRPLRCSDNSVSWPLELDTSDVIVGINPDSRLCLCRVLHSEGQSLISVVCTFPSRRTQSQGQTFGQNMTIPGRGRAQS